MVTTLCQIEACVNSRSMCPISDDPDDINCLTPGQFLIGEPLISINDLDIIHLRLNTLNRWQHLQRLMQGFWKIWQNDYVNYLHSTTTTKFKTIFKKYKI